MALVQEEAKLVSDASVIQSLENHPGWPIILERLSDMLTDATETLNNVKPTDVDGVLAAHRDWRAVKQVRETLLGYMADLKKTAAAIVENQKEQVQ